MTGVLSLFSLEGKTAICTGATRGLGQAMALGLAEAGADIILAQVNTLSIIISYSIKLITLYSATQPT
jgi:2-deoxy-D-gluconate 3-dehydrogenase